MKKLCIYHANCADGFTAAWVVWKKYGAENVDFHPGVYGEEPPDCTGRDVIAVDFSYKKDTTLKILDVCNSLLILDHHKTTLQELGQTISHTDPKLEMVLDMERSGARIAWDNLFGGQKPPKLLLHVEDRDLWRFKFDDTKEIIAGLFSEPYDFKVWEILMSEDLKDIRLDGAAILKATEKNIREIIPVATRTMHIAGYDVPVTNTNHMFGSQLCEITCKGKPFSAYYWDSPTKREFGLRSEPGGLDVSLIAKQFGGGGHEHAAGFKISFDKVSDLGGPSL